MYFIIFKTLYLMVNSIVHLKCKFCEKVLIAMYDNENATKTKHINL